MYIWLVCAALSATTIDVDVSKRESTPVPREFFGQFGEHLGYNLYGGQWAQLLRNPSFEGYDLYACEVDGAKAKLGLPEIDAGRELGLACYWLPEGDAAYALDPENPFNSNVSQRIKVTLRGGVRTPLMLPLHRVRTYDLSFYARTTAATPAYVEMRDAAGKALANASLRVDGEAWTRCAVRLDVAEGPGPGDLCWLAIKFVDPVTVWLDHAELFPVDHVNGQDPDVVRLMKELHVSLLRFPGGNFVSGYHWRDGVGPREKRVTMPNLAWPIVETNHYGTHEWVDFARAIGAEPLICVNCGNGSPEEAADWIRYCNEPAEGEFGRLRAANGHPEPFNVRYWEVGNELWGDWQVGHCPAKEYAARYDAFARAMRAADSSILLIANGGPGEWNRIFLENVTEPARSLSMHWLVGGAMPTDATAEDAAMALAAYGLDLERQLEHIQALGARLGHPDVKVAITELMSVARRASPPVSCHRHAEVLYFAGVMNACIRHRDLVELITRTAVINHGGGRSKIHEIAFAEPVHYLSLLYGTMSGRWPVGVTVDAPTYDVDIPGMAKQSGVPEIECLALLDESGRELTLVVTNRDARNDHPATIRLHGFEPKPTAGTRTIAGEPDRYNGWNAPPAVALVPGETATGPECTYTFPKCSVTEVVLIKK
ncbi:MAG TPA: alpha-L-arabinofuranosidase C-terminal domain-containing protein [Candidatus Hydrogenedentes bacterium]|nr:alpha-L-arabinofuranosidase C-terminal domain-containing protein [Candidatus Hydrogenedentota bacterium]HPG69034.1 alpha-L-arabinofuranosidase C-terminal domain-containing protein [Candidatus Hydrogenedentota bacterium]